MPRLDHSAALLQSDSEGPRIVEFQRVLRLLAQKMKQAGTALLLLLLVGCADRSASENRAAVRRALQLPMATRAAVGAACDQIIRVYSTNTYGCSVVVHPLDHPAIPRALADAGARFVVYSGGRLNWEPFDVYIGVTGQTNTWFDEAPFLVWSRQVGDHDNVQWEAPPRLSLRDPAYEDHGHHLEVTEGGRMP